MRPHPQTIIIAVFLAVALLMAAIAAFTAATGVVTHRREIAAPGYVVDLVVRTDPAGSEFYYPVVAFTGPDGSRRTIQVSEGSRPPVFKRDDPVTVAYDPGRPLDVRIVTFSSSLNMWIVPLITGALAAAFLAATLFARWAIRSDSDA